MREEIAYMVQVNGKNQILHLIFMGNLARADEALAEIKKRSGWIPLTATVLFCLQDVAIDCTIVAPVPEEQCVAARIFQRKKPAKVQYYNAMCSWNPDVAFGALESLSPR